MLSSSRSGLFRLQLFGSFTWEPEGDGTYFIDANPEIFEHLLRFIRRPETFLLFYNQTKGLDYDLYNRYKQRRSTSRSMRCVSGSRIRYVGDFNPIEGAMLLIPRAKVPPSSQDQHSRRPLHIRFYHSLEHYIFGQHYSRISRSSPAPENCTSAPVRYPFTEMQKKNAVWFALRWEAANMRRRHMFR